MKIIDQPLTVVLSDFHNERIFTPPRTWECVNHFYFTTEFEQWLGLHTPTCARVTHYRKVRSKGRWGNRGGWLVGPACVELIFENPDNKILFQLHWLK